MSRQHQRPGRAGSRLAAIAVLTFIALPPAGAETLTVLPGDLQGWAMTTSGTPLTASGSLVNGPASPPLGSGSAAFLVGSNGDGAAQLRHGGYAGVMLSDLDELKYSTHVTAFGSGGQAVYIILQLDIDLNGSVDDLLFFEPVYQHGHTANVPDQGPLVPGAWMEWDALAGGWWSLGGFAGAGPGAGVKTIAQYTAALPNARIANSTSGAGGVRLVAGFGAGAWDDFVGNADAFKISTATTPVTIHDFEVNLLELRAPVVLGPAEPIIVNLHASSGRSKVASIGARLTYDASRASLVSVARGSSVPASWSFTYQRTSTPGEVDVVLTDVSAAASTIAGPFAGLDILQLTFDRTGINCTPADFGFNPAPPVDAAGASAFPENQYLHFLDAESSSVVLDAASLSGVLGPDVDDHGFIRGNVNNRAAHALDLGDVIDMANSFFGSLPMDDCAAAYDTNDDGLGNITDLVTLVQGIFNSTEISIRPPSFSDPGVGIPGVVVPDGGTIPSIRGCERGETCP